MNEIIIPIGISTRYNKVTRSVNMYNMLIVSIYKNLFK